jgi:hypothetical protein
MALFAAASLSNAENEPQAPDKSSTKEAAQNQNTHIAPDHLVGSYEDVCAGLNGKVSPLDCASNDGFPHDRDLKMPPLVQPRQIVPKDRFAQLFRTLKTQAYHDLGARGAGTHT